MNKDDNTDLNELTDEMHEERLEVSLVKFWQTQVEEMAVLEIGTEQDFKNHNDLPLARIKRIMKSDEDVRMISAEGQYVIRPLPPSTSAYCASPSAFFYRPSAAPPIPPLYLLVFFFVFSFSSFPTLNIPLEVLCSGNIILPHLLRCLLYFALHLFSPAPVLFAKACEIFILEMTLRAWGAAEKSKRHTLQKEDIEAAIKNTDIFDFLVGL